MKNNQLPLALADLLPSAEGIKIESHDAFAIDRLPEVPPAIQPTSDFVESVRSIGRVLYPLIVINTGKKLIVKDGLRRLKTARQLGYTTVPVKEIFIDSMRGSVVGVVLNNCRSENPIHELDMLVELMKEGADEKLIHSATRMPVSRIRRRLHLLSLNKELRAWMRRGKLGVKVAEGLSRLPPPVQKRALRQLRKTGTLTAKDVSGIRKVEKKKVVSKLPDAMFETGNPNTDGAPTIEAWAANVQKLLSQASSLCSSSPKGDEIKAGIKSLLSKL